MLSVEKMTGLSESPGLIQERRRVRAHLVGAEQLVGGRRALAPLPAINRTLLLDELRRYRRRGRFPLNHDSQSRPVPKFIDSHGTRCAVAHLMEVSGLGEFVRHIAKTDNVARVHQLARLPEVRAWLDVSGLTLDEAARIQPEYCFLSEAEVCFCNQGQLTNLALGIIIRSDNTSADVRVQRIDGDIPGLMVGDEVSVMASGQVGESILFSRDPELGVVSRVGWNLAIDSDVRCQLNQGTARRPVTVDTTFEALLAEGPECVAVLANDESAWNQSQCGESQSDEGCGVARSGDEGAGSAALTSAAILAALLRYRRQRNR
jgi:MYXO-CTERM domain-containing protein